MFSINLKDAYFQVPVHLESRPYLWFVVQGTVYQFRVLCLSPCYRWEVFSGGNGLPGALQEWWIG